mgnify:CR=1 FL=1
MGCYVIIVYMWINKLREYDCEIECDENSCSLRYVKSGDTMGVLRYTYTFEQDTPNVYGNKKIRQDIVLLRTMDINNLIGDIMFNEQLTPEMGEYITTIIRMDGMDRIRYHLKKSNLNEV